MGEAWEEAGVEGLGDGLDALMEEARALQADVDGLDALMDGAGLDTLWDPEDMEALGAILDAMGGGPGASGGE